jgi:TIR domain
MQASPETRVAVVGRDSMENLRLADLLRVMIGPENVFRHLETEHLLTFLEEHAETPIVVFVDIFSFELQNVTDVIGEVRDRHPRVVFSVYMDPGEWRTRRTELPGEWSDRLDHYYRLYKVPNDEEFDPIVRQAFRQASREAQHNFGHEPIRITRQFDAGVLPPDPSPEARPLGEETVFVSYSRSDWDRVVSALTQRMQKAGFQLWVDQGFLVGGEDWMDAIGEALKKCSICLLVMSPDAMRSRYVKMEYRFFFNNDKPIVPVMVKPIPEFPPELSGIQHIDLTVESSSKYDELHRVLARYAGA